MTIILMDALYRDIEVGENRYEGVSRTTWACYLKLFRWLFEEGLGTPQVYQTGWAISVNEEVE